MFLYFSQWLMFFFYLALNFVIWSLTFIFRVGIRIRKSIDNSQIKRLVIYTLADFVIRLGLQDNVE
jgi:hypothetical protein